MQYGMILIFEFGLFLLWVLTGNSKVQLAQCFEVNNLKKKKIVYVPKKKFDDDLLSSKKKDDHLLATKSKISLWLKSSESAINSPTL